LRTSVAAGRQDTSRENIPPISAMRSTSSGPVTLRQAKSAPATALEAACTSSVGPPQARLPSAHLPALSWLSSAIRQTRSLHWVSSLIVVDLSLTNHQSG